MKRYLYFPVEVATRELVSRCLTAFVAAERGFDVLVGYQYTLLEHAHSLPRGIYLSKGSNGLAVQNMAAVKSKGHLAAALEEENFFRMLSGNPITYNNAGLPSVCDLYLAMGRDEQHHIQTQFGTSLNVALCGNPRTDILRPEIRQIFAVEADSLRSRYGRFVLVNTNIGVLNSVSKLLPEVQFQQWQSMGIFDASLSEQDQRAVFEDYLVFERNNTANLKGVLKGLADRDCTVILRPHPGEDKLYWQDYVDSLGVNSIHVTNDGSHLPMTLAADVLLHSGCTTGVEALLLDVPVVSMRAKNAKASSYYLSNTYNTVCETAESTLTVVDNHLAGSSELYYTRADFISGMGAYLEALESGPLSAELSVYALEGLFNDNNFSQDSSMLDSNREVKIWREHEQFTSSEYNRLKYGLNQTSVQEILKQFQQTLGMFSTVTACSLSETVSHVSAT